MSAGHRTARLIAMSCVTASLCLMLFFPFLVSAQGALPEPAASASRPPPVGQPVPPLDVRGKGRYWLRRTIGPGALAINAIAAGAEHEQGDPPEWGGGGQGYARRFADITGAVAVGSGVGFATSAAFGIDPRYYRCDCTGFWHRLGHAAGQTFIARTDRGRPTVAIPQLAGIYSGAMISQYWYPSRYDPLKDGFRMGNYGVLGRAGLNFVREFMPARFLRVAGVNVNDVYSDQ